MSTITRIERLAILQAIPAEDDSVDTTITPSRRGQDRHRPCDAQGQPAVDLEATLQAEVERTRERYEAACLDLRRYLMSHANDTRPTLTCKP